MRIIARGAEALLYVKKWQGQDVLVKERIKKRYRIKQIDQELRTGRTRRETKLLTEARKWGVPTPQILRKTKDKIVMEYIEGRRLKEYLNASNKETVERVCLKVGRLIGRLHSAGIVHGDLTTSNMMLSDGKIYFIDFGLGSFSKRIEDQGVDLNLLYEALKSTHFKILKTCWKNILKGYKQEYVKADKVVKKVEEIEKRARYAKR